MSNEQAETLRRQAAEFFNTQTPKVVTVGKFVAYLRTTVGALESTSLALGSDSPEVVAHLIIIAASCDAFRGRMECDDGD